jgi:hypothetical protein
MKLRWRPFHISLALVAATALLLVPGTFPASAGSPPSLKLISVQPNVTILRHKSTYPIPVDPAIYVEAINGNFEVRATRPDYDTPISLAQWIDGGNTIIPLPSSMDDGWNGFADFLSFHTTKTVSGDVVSDATNTFCPATYRQRIDDATAVQVDPYPTYGCGSWNPFTIGSVWGIPEGWGVGAAGASYGYGYYYGYYGGYGSSGGTSFKGPDGLYTTDVSIGAPYVSAFGISPADSTVTVHLTVQTRASCSNICVRTSGAASRAAPAPQEPAPKVPIDTNPQPATLPDLQALPSESMYVRHDRRTGHDFLSFQATVWNDGPADMVVEGFRQPAQALMDGYQYFYLNGVAVGRAPVGQLEYDPRPGHQHWHFKQFAEYSLLNATMTKQIISTKEAFCLAPTDPINLAGPGAQWQPNSIGLGTACGNVNSIWTRETLDAGWGDTYGQYLPGQAFNITHLPNGHYFVKIQANPDGLLYERDTTNNTSLREIVLKGKPGHRQVVVLPYHGIP